MSNATATEWMPYAKPTRRIHDSGFRMFEVGYISMDDAKKVVLYSGTDVISQDTLSLLNHDKSFVLRIDMNRRGYIRFFTFDGGIRWRGYVGSSADLEIGEWQPGADDRVIDLLATSPEDDTNVTSNAPKKGVDTE